MRKLLIYMKDYLRESILGPLFKFLEATFELFIPIVITKMIDIGIQTANQPYIVRMSMLLVALSVAGVACSITAQYYAAKASVGFAANIRKALFAHIQSLSYTELDTVGTATLMTRMTSDMHQVQTGVNLTLRLLLRSPFVVLGAMIMAFTLDVQAALVFVVVIPLLFLVVFYIMLKCIPLYRKVQQQLDRVMGLTKENLSGVRVIRAFRHEAQETQEFHKRTQTLADAQLLAGRFAILMHPLTYVIIHFAVIVLIWIGAIEVHFGALTQGAVVALYSYMSQILIELIKLANLLLHISRSIACGNRIQAMFAVSSTMHSPAELPPPTHSDTAIAFRDVSLQYAQVAAPSLHAIDFTVQKGQTIGIIGATGSGKSSLIQLIPRFYDASTGQVLVDGIDVTHYPLSLLRQKVGIVPQQSTLFKGTIRENMLWGNPHATDAQIMQALDTAQAANILLEKAHGLDECIEQGGKNLSGGQRQRLTIARTLLRNPEIIILDDSASALDAATDAALRQAIGHMRDRTVLIVSQRVASIRHADRILVLDNGRLVGNAAHDQLLRHCPIYREIYETQFQGTGECR